MRFTLALDLKNRPIPDSFGQSVHWTSHQTKEAQSEVRLVRLPRRIAKFLRACMDPHMDRWNPDHVEYHARYHLQETNVSRLLSRADAILPQRRTFRRRAPRAWRVGDPCYVNGEGHGNLLFIQAIEGSTSIIVNGCRESAHKVYRPTFRELVLHLEDNQEELARLSSALDTFWTPKARREASGRARRELQGLIRRRDALTQEVLTLQNYLTS